MTVLGRGLVFQPVLVTQTCTDNSNNIITLQNIDITDFPSKKKKFKRTHQPPPPPPKKPHNNKKRSHDSSECFDMSLKLSKLHVKKWQRSKSNDKHNRIYLTIDKTKICVKTALTNNSNLNKTHDTEIQTYKQAATTANNPGTTKGRKETKQTNKQTKNNNNVQQQQLQKTGDRAK